LGGPKEACVREGAHWVDPRKHVLERVHIGWTQGSMC